MNQQQLPIRTLLWRAYLLSTLLPVLIIPALFFGGYLYATSELERNYTRSLQQQASFHQLTLNRLLAQQIGDALDELLPAALKSSGVAVPPLELIRQLRQRNRFQLADNDYYRIFVEKDGSFYDVRTLELVPSSENPFATALNEILATDEGSRLIHEQGPHLLTWSSIPIARWRLLTLSASTTPGAMLQEAQQQLNRVLIVSSAAATIFSLLLIWISYRNARRLSHRLITPLQTLNSMIRAIGQGNYQPKREPIDIAEMEESAQGLASMGRELGQARQDLLAAKEHLEKINSELEARVSERTRALEKAYLQLKADKQEQERLFKQLQQAQVKLIESEKMASIGQLAAGVAHEINNPMTYIIANLTALRDYAGDLIALIDSLGEALRRHDPDTASSLQARFDYDFLQGDLPKLIEQSLDGADRVKQIVQSLRDFSHGDQQEWTRADLIRGIRSTLKIAHNEIKHRARVETDLEPLPEIDCRPSQLNQVLLNLFVNAAQAIPEDREGVIKIRTRNAGGQVIIEVEDNGCGMDEETRRRIFDPFFTTKPIGKGTGLGLSLSFGIIQSHNGTIEVESTPDVGTCFRIRLPVRQKAG